MEPLTPWLAISGGLLVGAAVAIYLLVSGRVAGISGIVASTLRIGTARTSWSQSAAFLLALVLGAWLAATYVRTPTIAITSSVPLLVVAGLMVGWGARFANGCTSGHAICGVSRLSPRSLVATATFLTAATATVFINRHLLGA